MTASLLCLHSAPTRRLPVMSLFRHDTDKLIEQPGFSKIQTLH